jgi:hypothetical protein
MAMKALDRVKREGKRAREDNALADDVINKTAEFFAQAMALELHEKDGFGKKRMEDRCRGLFNRCTEMVERYGEDFAYVAMREKAKEIGFEISISSGKKYNLRLKEDITNG